MNIKKEELHEFQIESCSAMGEDPEPIHDPLSACIKIKLEETVALTDEAIPEASKKLVSDNNNVGLNSRIQGWRKRKYDLESLEESKARRFRARIMTIKSRLIAKLELPDSELEAKRKRDINRNVLRRNKRLEKQTPEEIAARKVSLAEQTRWVRNCLEATESAEETARRKTKEREKIRNSRAIRIANESEKERAARKEKERENRERFKQRKLEKSRQKGNQ